MSVEQNFILKKRDSLQSFVREQLIGPGAFNKKYYLLSTWNEHEFSGRLISNCYCSENVSEVIAEVPAYQYSSGILFPMVNVEETVLLLSSEELDSLPDTDEQAKTINGEDEFVQDQTESVSSKNQNYPNTLGVSIAINADSNISRDLNVFVSFRTYSKVKQKQLSSLMLGHWIQFDALEIKVLVEKYLNNVFRVEERDGNYFVLANEQIDLNDYLYIIDYDYLERVLRDTIMPLVASIYPKDVFFEKTQKNYGGILFEYHFFSESKLMDKIQMDLKKGVFKLENVKELYTALERYHRIKSIVTDLKTIYRRPSLKNQPTPVWAARTHQYSIRLHNPDGKKETIRGEIDVDRERNLYLNYQYLFHSNGLTYIKLILVNRNNLVLKSDEPPQLNKKDRANELSFFGVELSVKENLVDILQPYNPPNLISVDQEDNFNKILYRDYKDYGEGYNTSVEWGQASGEQKLRFVRTEFLPQQDTPDVDFEPTERLGNRLLKLTDRDALDIKSLSTLSDRSDLEIRQSLEVFINSYGKWVLDKSKILNESAENFSQSDREILNRQLSGCEMDFKRLKRNLELLFGSAQALAAFKVMNTAMYMQLVHGRTIKEKGFYIPGKNDMYNYKSCSDVYHWRSFQLAFILLNIDGFVRPDAQDHTVADVFGTGWPERNEIADLVWFPTGGGKTEAYLGIIGFCIAYRRFTQVSSESGGGTAILMRYTLRLLTLQQFQRATLLICALEVMRKDNYPLPAGYKLGEERINIGLFVGGSSLPNTWKEMQEELQNISEQLRSNPENSKPNTRLPLTECPWCGGGLFKSGELINIDPPPKEEYTMRHSFTIMCNSPGCTFNAEWPKPDEGIPVRIFDEDLYKYPPTLLFGTVDKFAALANNVEESFSERKKDSRRFFGRGTKQENNPPELIIQDELHLLLGPLGSAVGLFEKAVDECCTIRKADGTVIRPKIITSTATTRNTDKQIFALFNRRTEIFPKQGICADNSFFANYKRNPNQVDNFVTKRRYVGVLPVGKTQVWMQLRIASIALAHRIKYMREEMGNLSLLEKDSLDKIQLEAMDYYHTVLSYFNSLKEVGKTQSQLTHYLPGDLDLIIDNTIGWTVIGQFVRPTKAIQDGELTGRLNGEQVKSNLAKIQRKWNILGVDTPPEFVISTNMISVGIDVSRFNIMVINSMPRNIAEYIQASSRVARDKEGIVFTVHHPFRSRDISHYQRFIEFHEKFYSYVEPISVTPFADKALERYFAMFIAVMVRHNTTFMPYRGNKDAGNLTSDHADLIKKQIMSYMREIHENGIKLNSFMKRRDYGITVKIEGVLDDDELKNIDSKVDELVFERWLNRLSILEKDFRYRHDHSASSLFFKEGIKTEYKNWNVKYSLREVAPTIVIKTLQQ